MAEWVVRQCLEKDGGTVTGLFCNKCSTKMPLCNQYSKVAIIGQFCMYMAVRDWKLIGDFEMEAAAVGRQFFNLQKD